MRRAWRGKHEILQGLRRRLGYSKIGELVTRRLLSSVPVFRRRENKNGSLLVPSMLLGEQVVPCRASSGKGEFLDRGAPLE